MDRWIVGSLDHWFVCINFNPLLKKNFDKISLSFLIISYIYRGSHKGFKYKDDWNAFGEFSWLSDVCILAQFIDCSTSCDHNCPAQWGREGNWTMNPSYCIRNTGNSQKLFHATPILFRATSVEFWTCSRSEFCKYLKKKVKMKMRRKGKKVAFQLYFMEKQI